MTRSRPILSLTVVLLAALLLAAPPVSATVVVPVPESTLAHHAAAIVVGQVVAIESHWDAQAQQIFTQITIQVEEVLKGRAAVSLLTIKQVGGRIGGVESWIEGSPEFAVGERVLLFLRPGTDGVLRVAHLFQGKFTIETDPYTGEELAYRPLPQGVHAVSGPGAAGVVPGYEIHPFREFAGRLRQTLARRTTTTVTPPASLAQGSAGTTSSLLTQTAAQFTFLGTPARWFEPDSGRPVSVLVNASGEPLAPSRGTNQILDAFHAWSGVAGASFQYQYGGSTTNVGLRGDGVNAISFRDPLGQIDNPVGCSGVLAVGGYFRTSETRVVGGQTFARIVEGDVVVNDGWQGCGFYESYANFAEVMAHELGHVLGLGHSGDRTALMYGIAHFDGRGATLSSDDVAGLLAIYPGGAPSYTLQVSRAGAGQGTVISSPTGVSCGTDCSERYLGATRVTLTATPAQGSTFTGWSGGGCSGTGTCVVTMSADASVTATFVLTNPLAASIAVGPSSLRVGSTITVQLTVTNNSAQRTTVTAGTPTVQGTGAVKLTSGPSGGVTLDPRRSATFTWRYQATGVGQVRFTDQATSPVGPSLQVTSGQVTITR